MARNQGDMTRAAAHMLDVMQSPFVGPDEDDEQDDESITRQALLIAQTMDSGPLQHINQGTLQQGVRNKRSIPEEENYVEEVDPLQEALRISEQTSDYDNMVREAMQKSPGSPPSQYTGRTRAGSQYGGAASDYGGGSQYGGARSQYGGSSQFSSRDRQTRRYNRTTTNYNRSNQIERGYQPRYNSGNNYYSGNAPYGGDDRNMYRQQTNMTSRRSQQQQQQHRPFQSKIRKGLKKWLTPERAPSPYRYGNDDRDSQSDSESNYSGYSSGTPSSYRGGAPGPAYSSYSGGGGGRRRGPGSVAPSMSITPSGAPDLDDLISSGGNTSSLFSSMDPIALQALAEAGLVMEGAAAPQESQSASKSTAKDPYLEAKEMLIDLEQQKRDVEQEQEQTATRAREISSQIAEVDPMADIQTGMTKMAQLAEEYQYIQMRQKDLEDISNNIGASILELKGMLNNQEQMQGTFSSDQQQQLQKVMLASLLHEIEQKRKVFKQKNVSVYDDVPNIGSGILGGGSASGSYGGYGSGFGLGGGGSGGSYGGGGGGGGFGGALPANASVLFQELEKYVIQRDYGEDMAHSPPSESYTPGDQQGTASDARSEAGSNVVQSRMLNENGEEMVTVPVRMVKKLSKRRQAMDNAEEVYSDYEDDEDDDDDDDDSSDSGFDDEDYQNQDILRKPVRKPSKKLNKEMSGKSKKGGLMKRQSTKKRNDEEVYSEYSTDGEEEDDSSSESDDEIEEQINEIRKIRKKGSKKTAQTAEQSAQAASIPIEQNDLQGKPPEGDGPGVNANLATPNSKSVENGEQQQIGQQQQQEQEGQAENGNQAKAGGASKEAAKKPEQKGESLEEQLKKKNLKSADERKLADQAPPSGANVMDMDIGAIMAGLIGDDGGNDDKKDEKKEPKPGEAKDDKKSEEAEKKKEEDKPKPPPKKAAPPPPPPGAGGRGRGPPPPPGRGRGRRGGPPPPPGRGRGRGGGGDDDGTGVAQNRDVIKMFQELKRALMGGGGGGGPKKIGGGGASAAPADKGAMMQEIMGKSQYQVQLQEDMVKYADMVKDLIKELAQKQAKDMKELIDFVNYVDEKLSILSDETAVLKSFENWPTSRHDAMREARAMHKNLMEMKDKMENWKLPARLTNVQEELGKIQGYQDKIQVKMDGFIRTKDGDEKKFQEHKIPWPKTIHQEVMHGSLHLAEVYMDLVLKEVDKLNGMDLDNEKKREKHQAKALTHLTNAVRFAFRVHQFAGGFNDSCNQKFQELCIRTRTAMPKKEGK